MTIFDQETLKRIRRMRRRESIRYPNAPQLVYQMFIFMIPFIILGVAIDNSIVQLITVVLITLAMFITIIRIIIWQYKFPPAKKDLIPDSTSEAIVLQYATLENDFVKLVVPNQRYFMYARATQQLEKGDIVKIEYNSLVPRVAILMEPDRQ